MAINSILDSLWQSISLFAGTFIQEDAAILAGAYLVVVKKFPAAVAYTSLLSGVVVGDFVIYGIGRLARRWDKLRWITARINASAAHKWLDRRLFIAVGVSRVLPTLTFPTFAACGWLGIPFKRFAAAAVMSAVIYVSTTFTLLMIYGRSLPPWATTYGWVGLGGVVLLVWIVRRAVSRRQQRIVLSREPNVERRPSGHLAVHKGMPPLDPSKVRVAFSERIPPVIYYIPLLIQWLLLSLRYRSLTVPTVANPRIEAGGLIGESKSECMSMPAAVAERWLARTTAIDARGPGDLDHDLRQARMALANASLDYPIIAKPDIGWRGFGVRRIEDESQLRDYLSGFPEGQRVILQEYVPWHGEAGVFYVRRPGRENGEIFSLTLRYFPFVVGDGVSDLRTLMLANSRTRWKKSLLFDIHRDRLDTVPRDGEAVRLAIVGSNRVGGLYINGNNLVTPALTQRIDEITKSMPEFHFGRFDLRFESIEAFQQGENFSIIEINGAGAEAVHIWDPDFPLRDAYRVLFAQQSLMFAIGAANRRRGFKPLGAMDLIRYQQRQQKLLPIYPASG